MMSRFYFRVVLLCCGALLWAIDAPSWSFPKAAEVCSGCHGAQGRSIHPEWPHLAGQHASYLEKQLHDFKDNTVRHADAMTPWVQTLTDKDMNDLAAFYSKMPPVGGRHFQSSASRGQRLYRQGDVNQGITACIACHGPNGSGNPQAKFPVLLGQQPAYTVQQLQAFKEGRRQNDDHAIMRDISARLSQADMEALALYLKGVE